ncbi:MAG: FkbM family methyltransferase [Acidobacteriia bacterium]|nr:FkbM family methyltransferase [Terriglobia bacterium]
MKKLFHRIYLRYEAGCPIARGKYRLGHLMDRAIGRVAYTIDGLVLMLSPVSLLDRRLIRGEEYDRFVVNVVTGALSEGGHFIDIGANIGYVSLVAAKCLGTRGTVFSFEPSPREYARLRQHCVANSTRNVVVVNKGIGAVTERTVLRIADIGNHGMNSRHSIRSAMKACLAEFIPITDALPLPDLAQARCVKIDVEGDEMNVLRSFEPVMETLRFAVFVVEITPSYLRLAGHSAADVYNFFSAYEFQPLRPASVRSATQYDEVFAHPARGSLRSLRDVLAR